MTHAYEPAITNDFEHVVLIAVKFRETAMEVRSWLWENIDIKHYEELFAHYTPADGKWLSGPEAVLWGAVFKYEVDATAFKLRWC